MNNIFVNKWNMLDTLIYKVESCMAQLKLGLKDNKDEFPDPEEIIEAATEQLRHENDELRRKQYPGKIRKEGNQYFCPDCNAPLSPELIRKKFCPECGKRIVLQKNLYVTSHS